nr:1,4-dihydroxy-6-naphthoate synthase [Dissulfurirhabdus thermomarina]
MRLGISPCPNDTFIFDALLHGRVASPFEWELTVADVEELNRLVLAGRLDVAKVSFHAFGLAVDDYVLLRSGSALGRGCGPLLLARAPMAPEAAAGGPIAVPGSLTTAALLLRLFLPGARRFEPMLFSRIPGAVAAGEVPAGVVIHESRFTYRELGLVCLQDLGAWWEAVTGRPIPLGGIVARRALGEERIRAVDRALAASVRHARKHPDASREFVAAHARELDPGVIRAHIGLYVTAFTEEIGAEGEAAVAELFRRAAAAGVFPDRGGGAGRNMVLSREPGRPGEATPDCTRR